MSKDHPPGGCLDRWVFVPTSATDIGRYWPERQAIRIMILIASANSGEFKEGRREVQENGRAEDFAFPFLAPNSSQHHVFLIYDGKG